MFREKRTSAPRVKNEQSQGFFKILPILSAENSAFKSAMLHVLVL